jgi:rfaE bifunctional protein kinase chain/domain
MDITRFDQLLAKFPALHVAVVGDFFLDKYLDIDPALTEISLETGLEAYQVVRVRCNPGAAGTVVSNLRAMEVQVSAVGVIGPDGEGFDLRQGLRRQGVNIDALIESPERFTPTYTKPMMLATGAGVGTRELNRLDIKNRRPLPDTLTAAVIAQLEQLVPLVDGVIIADQVQERNCGVITDRVRAALARLAAAYPAKIFAVDSRVRIGEFEQVIIKPNLREAQAAVESEIRGEGEDKLAAARACGQRLWARNQKPVFITLAEQGILAVSTAGIEHIPGIPVTGEIDIVGAGDSVMAGLVSALGAGATAPEAALIGNLAASITIQQIGVTGTASREQLRERFNRADPDLTGFRGAYL